jgi:hypothetical protein
VSHTMPRGRAVVARNFDATSPARRYVAVDLRPVHGCDCRAYGTTESNALHALALHIAQWHRPRVVQPELPLAV